MTMNERKSASKVEVTPDFNVGFSREAVDALIVALNASSDLTGVNFLLDESTPSRVPKIVVEAHV